MKKKIALAIFFLFAKKLAGSGRTFERFEIMKRTKFRKMYCFVKAF